MPALIPCLFALALGPLRAAGDTGRPTPEAGPTLVHVQIYFLDVDGVNSADQSFQANVFYRYRWHDPRLAGGAAVESRPVTSVWTPALQILNQQRLQSTLPETVQVTPDGEVSYVQRVWGSFSQPLSLEEFPFDHQQLVFKLGPAVLRLGEVELALDPQTTSGIAPAFSLADWSVEGWRAEADLYQPIPEIPGVPTFQLAIEIQRYRGYYWLKIILPLILIVAMSWLVFWTDPKDSGSQISVSITSMLTLIAYRFAVGSDLPKVSYLTRLDTFILAATVLVFLTLLEVLTTMALTRRGEAELARRVDRWSRLGFPLVFAAATYAVLLR